MIALRLRRHDSAARSFQARVDPGVDDSSSSCNYEQALGAKLEVLMSGADSPMAAQIPKELAHRILHARLALPGGEPVPV